MMTDSLPLILTLLKVGAGGAGRVEPADAVLPLGAAPAAGVAAAAAAVGLGASVGLASAAGAGFEGAAGCWLPQAARIGRAAAIAPSRKSLRREMRPGSGEPIDISLTRHLLA